MILHPLRCALACTSLVWSACASDATPNNKIADAGTEPDAPTVTGPAVRVEARPLEPVLASIEMAMLMTGCIAGGEEGREDVYIDSVPEQKINTLDYTYNVALATALELPADPTALDVDLLTLEWASFPPGPPGPISSADTFSGSISFSSQIMPDQFGVWYRQASRMDFHAELFGITATGDEYNLGQATLSNWSWTVGMSWAPSCPPIPATTLPEPMP